ncbi:uncharacterized protein [Ptychodera flava]|uniref:uncharacterized protein isoform X2 n=1 Tax=Ptychodera flava TaxID=63121 RepID=UPI00396A715D
MMLPEQLITIENRKVVIDNWFLYMEHLMKAYRFHAVSQTARQKVEFKEDGEEYTHRNYTDSEHGVCTTINIENYSKRKPFEYSCHIETAKTGSSVDRDGKHRWDLQFWPKGQQKPALTEFGNAYLLQTDNVTLALDPLGRLEEAFKIVIAIQGRQNDMNYIKKVHQYTHDFGVKMMFRIRDLFCMHELTAGDSQYLHNDALTVKLIIRPCKPSR